MLENGATAWGSRGRSEDEWAFDVVVIVFAVVLNLVLPIFSKMVDSNAVGFSVDNGKEFSPKLYELSVIHFAFEDGVLNALSVVEAGLGDVAQSFLTGFGDGRYIVGEQDIHFLKL